MANDFTNAPGNQTFTGPDPDLLTTLNDLRIRLMSHGEPVFVQQYNHFVTHSEFGFSCGYAKKCKELFLKYDYEELRDLFLKTLEQFRLVEGKDFGK
jgi:hypothetical protein